MATTMYQVTMWVGGAMWLWVLAVAGRYCWQRCGQSQCSRLRGPALHYSLWVLSLVCIVVSTLYHALMGPASLYGSLWAVNALHMVHTAFGFGVATTWRLQQWPAILAVSAAGVAAYYWTTHLLAFFIVVAGAAVLAFGCVWVVSSCPRRPARDDMRAEYPFVRLCCFIVCLCAAQLGTLLVVDSGSWVALLAWSVYASTGAYAALRRDWDSGMLSGEGDPLARGCTHRAPLATDSYGDHADCTMLHDGGSTSASAHLAAAAGAGYSSVRCLTSFNVHGMPIVAAEIMARPRRWRAAIERAHLCTLREAGTSVGDDPFTVVCVQEAWGHRAGFAWPVLFLASWLRIHSLSLCAQGLAALMGFFLPWVLWDNKEAILSGGRPTIAHRRDDDFELFAMLSHHRRTADHNAQPLPDDGRPTSRREAEAAQAPFRHAVGLRGHSMAWSPTTMLDSGLLILSSRRPSASGFTPFTCRSGESGAHKGILWAYFPQPSHTLIINTHMTGGAPAGTDRKQMQQLASLARRLMRRFSGASPLHTWLCGDFNYTAPHVDFALLQPEFVLVTKPNVTTVNPPRGKCVDHVLYCKWDESGASDNVVAATPSRCAPPPHVSTATPPRHTTVPPLVWPGHWDFVSDHAITRVVVRCDEPPA